MRRSAGMPMTGLWFITTRFHPDRGPGRRLLSCTDSRLRPGRGPSLDHSPMGLALANAWRSAAREWAYLAPFAGLPQLAGPAYAAAPAGAQALKIINTGI